MWIKFDANGIVKGYATNTGESAARVGSTDFVIYAIFEGINVSEFVGSATIAFQKPDLYKSIYLMLFMDRFYDAEYTGVTNSELGFTNGQTYSGFKFDFSSFTLDDDDNLVLLDTPGLWNASITIFNSNTKRSVQGLATFNVQDSAIAIDETTLTMETILGNIGTELAKKVDATSTLYVKVADDFTVDAEAPGNLDAGVFVLGSAVFDKTTKSFYLITAVTPNPGDSSLVSVTYELVMNVGDNLVVGPASSVDGDVVLFNGTTGRLIRDSGVNLNSKLDKINTSSSYDRAYAVKPEGTQEMINVSTPGASLPNAIPRYSSAGRLQTEAPSDSKDAATKKYVDDSVSVIADITDLASNTDIDNLF